MKKTIKYLWKNEKAILLIFVLGLFLRLLGTFPGYPLTHPDEPTIGTPSIRMVFEGNFRPQSYYYGSLLSLIYAATYVIFFIPLSFIFFLPGNLDLLANGLPGFFDFLEKGALLHKQTLWSISYWARYDSAILSSSTIIAIYLLGKQLFNRPIALVAAFFVAVNYRHVLSSRLILADAPAAFFATLALLLFIAIIKKNSLRNYLAAGIAIALALSVKYFVYVIPAFFLCHFLATFKKFFALLDLKVILAITVAVILFFAINPYLLLAREEAAYYWAANSARYGLHLSPDILTVNNLSYYSLYYLYHYGLGPLLTIATIVGFLLSFIRHTKSTLILTSIVLPFLYTFLVISGTGMVRNYAAIIPLLLFFPAVFIYEVSHLIQVALKKNYLQHITIIILGFVVGYQSFSQSLVSGYNLSREQNMISLYWWIERNLPDATQILGPSGIFYPAGRNFEAVRFYLEGNNFPAMEDIKQKKVSWIISTNTPSDVTENLLLNKQVVKEVFFNKQLLNELSMNNYTTLAFKELADYRQAEFAKPFTQDPPYFIARFPTFWQTREDNKIANFDFNSKDEITKWEYIAKLSNSYEYSYSLNDGVKQSGALKLVQNAPHCTTLFSKLSSEPFSAMEQKWYSFVGWGKRTANENYKNTRNGFFRLDFYNNQGKFLKTYVTGPLDTSNLWQKLSGAGMAPHDSTTARVSFQTDLCLDNEQYIIDNLSVFVAKEAPSIKPNDYPFYSKGTELFDWLPQL